MSTSAIKDRLMFKPVQPILVNRLTAPFETKMPYLLAEIASGLFWALIGGLAAGSVGKFALHRVGAKALADALSRAFNRATTYLR